MRISIGLGASLFVAGVLLALFQLWFVPWSPEIFLKMEITIGAFFLVVLVVYFVVKEYGENKTTRSGDRLDD
jgi:hypothetical protein